MFKLFRRKSEISSLYALDLTIPGDIMGSMTMQIEMATGRLVIGRKISEHVYKELEKGILYRNDLGIGYTRIDNVIPLSLYYDEYGRPIKIVEVDENSKNKICYPIDKNKIYKLVNRYKEKNIIK